MVFKHLCRWKVVGRENLPETGPVLVVANHVSNWDPVVLGAALGRQVHFMAKEELFRIPILGAIVSRVGAFKVKRGHSDRAALREANAILTEGKIVGIFPEGTRSKSGHLQEFKAGAALLALHCGVPVLPVALIGTNKLWRRGWFHSFEVRIGELLPVNEAETVNSKAVLGFATKIKEAVAELIRSRKKVDI